MKKILAQKVIRPKEVFGIYKKTMWNTVLPETFFNDTNITGITFMAYWWQMNPEPGVYNWERLDYMCNMAAKYNKKIGISIGTGTKSPRFVLDRSGVLTFVEFNHVKTGSKPTPSTIAQPIVFHEPYVTNLVEFITALGKHMRSQPYWTSVTYINNGGISRTTVEVRLPAQDKEVIGGITSTDAPKLWKSVGYTPALIIESFNTISTAYIAAFPKRTIVYSFINSGDFIAGTPDVFSECTKSLYEKCEASDKLNPVLFKYTAVSNGGRYSKRMSYINSFGGELAGQLEEQKYSTLPLSDSADLIGALDLAIAHKMKFIELDGETAERFPGIINLYNQKLTPQ